MNNQQEWTRLMELHYVNGIDFPFLHQKNKEKPRKIERQPLRKPPKDLHIVTIWRQR